MGFHPTLCHNAHMKKPIHQQIFDNNEPQFLIDLLTPYVSATRQQRIQTVIDGRLHNIQLAIECPADINNALAAIRTAEAMGLSTVHIITPEHTAASGINTTRGAIYWVEVKYYSSLKEFLETANKIGRASCRERV